ncbi:MAG TPA: hypothetical protein PLC79_00075 [Phycisphaerae bacterium]|nr:hypothetical protein [Phycisphaerae bacterium]
MLGMVNILAVRDDDASQLIWVIAVLLLSVIGTIFGKLNEAAKKKKLPPRAPRPDESDAAAGGDRGASPPRPRETASRPMPRVPRPPMRAGDRPIGIPRPKGPVTTPERARPVPPRQPGPRRPVPPLPSRRVGPGPVRTIAPEVAVARPEGTVAPTPKERPVSPVPAPPAPAPRAIPLNLAPARLREMIVLREILDPPVSMRDESSWF